MSATVTELERSAPLRKRGAALEDAIRAAAYEELTEVGYTAFSVESVAARARTGKASIYRRWPTKADLVFDALCTELPTPAQCGLEEQLPPDISTVDALREVATKIAGIMQSPAGQVMRAIKCEALSDPDLARAIDDRFQAPRRAAMLDLLRRGVERGEVRPEAVCPVVADILPAILTFRIIMQREPVSAAAIREIIDQVLVPVVQAR
jgi:AcrR family transcriptional regulator